MSYTHGDTILDVGFDGQEGFFVIDHVRRRAAYAYPSSAHAVMAKSRPAYAVARMVHEMDLDVSPAEVIERHYQAVCRNV